MSIMPAPAFDRINAQHIVARRRGAARHLGVCMALLSGGTLLAPLGGCDNQDPTSVAIDRARVSMEKISLPLNPVGVENDQVEAGLSRIVTDLRTASANASAGQKQAAAMLMAQAQLAVADRRAALSGGGESQSAAGLMPIRRAIDQVLWLSSASAAAQAYDAGPEIERLQREIQSKDAEIAQRQRDRAQVEGDILLLEQGAKERLDLAAARREEAARMAVQAMSLSTGERASRMEEVHRLRREAAVVEVDGATLQARAEVRRPDLVERQMLVDQVVGQKAALVEALERARRQATEARAQAAEHATAAASAIDQLHDLITATLAQRAQVDTLVATAADAYASALTSARAATTDGIALVGASAQGRGDVHWARGQNLGQLATLLEQAAAIPVPSALPSDAQERASRTLAAFAQQAADLRAKQKAALTEAGSAYGEARDAFQRVRGTDAESRARVNRLAQLMHLSRRGAQGQAIDLTTITDEQGDFSEEQAPGDEPIQD